MVFCFRITNADIQTFRITNPKGQRIVNVAVTLIHQVDSAMGKYIKVLQDNFAKKWWASGENDKNQEGNKGWWRIGGCVCSTTPSKNLKQIF